MNRFIADENIPSRVIERLRDAGYDVVTVSEAAAPGIRNDELAEVSLRIGRVVLSRDADFTRLKIERVNSATFRAAPPRACPFQSDEPKPPFPLSSPRSLPGVLES